MYELSLNCCGNTDIQVGMQGIGIVVTLAQDSAGELNRDHS